MIRIVKLKPFRLPTPHDAQEEILSSTARFVVVACGRRFGKTTLGQEAIIQEALIKHHACWWLAPTYGMASQVWRDLKAACARIKNIRISETERRIDFPKGGWLAIRSTHYPDNLRGAGLDFAVLDEAAYMDASVWPEVVRPMLLERRGRALFLSSPNGLNWFWEIYQLGLRNSSSSTQAETNSESVVPRLHKMERGLGGEVFPSLRSGERLGEGIIVPNLAPSTSHLALLPKEDRRHWRSYHFPSSANPLVTADELDSIRQQTNDRVWRQEYLAEFTADIGQVFRAIREAATAPLGAAPIPGVRYICGLDWGRDNDSTVIVVFRADTCEMVALDRFNQVNWSLQRARLIALYDRWQPSAIWAESNSIGSPNIEALQSEGLPVRPFHTTFKTKSPLIENLALAIERRQLALLPDETLLAELASYTMRRSAAGNYLYAAPSGQHDDCVIATALAWHGLRHSGPSIDFA